MSPKAWKKLKNFLISKDKNKKDYFLHKRFCPFISLFLLCLVFILCRVEAEGAFYRLIAVILGFLLVAVRSYLKEWRLLEREKEKEQDLIKAPIDMFWPYFINYPIILSSIYILGSYFLENRGYPNCVVWAILFLLAYFVDIVWEKIGDTLNLLKAK